MPASKFTSETRAVITTSLRAGTSLADACRDIGLRLKTAETWITRGRREEEGPYADFAAAVDEAREVIERAALGRDDFDKHLAKAVRAGSVQAMKLWADIHIRGKEGGDPDASTADPFDELDDDLSKRRAQRA